MRRDLPSEMTLPKAFLIQSERGAKSSFISACIFLSASSSNSSSPNLNPFFDTSWNESELNARRFWRTISSSGSLRSRT